jgi:hypothetical protein
MGEGYSIWVFVAAAVSAWSVIGFVYPVLRVHSGAARRLALTSPEACLNVVFALVFGAMAVYAAGPTAMGVSAKWFMCRVYAPSLIARYASLGRLAIWFINAEPPPEVTALTFRRKRYGADVALDGCMTHLVVRGHNFLMTRPHLVRGAFLCQNDAQLEGLHVKQPSEDGCDRAKWWVFFGSKEVLSPSV